MKHQGTQRLETERLILRRAEPADAGAMYANWASDPKVTAFLTWPPHESVEVSSRVLAGWIEGYARPDRYDWVIELKGEGAVVGSLSVVHLDEAVDEAEIGYCIGRRWWGMGIVPEAGAAVVRFLFEAVGAGRVSAKHDVDNPNSGRVMRKLGMTLEGIRRRGGRNNRGVADMACYAILAETYFRAKAGLPETWDARDREGRSLGVELVRGEPVPEGMYHVVCETAVRHVDGRYLLMQRAFDKPAQPGRLELTAGGSALRGESPLACIRRELYEETGIVCDSFEPVDVIVREDARCLFYIYCCETDCELSSIRLQPGETVGCLWVTRERLLEMLDGPELVPATRARYRKYFESARFR